MKSFFLLLILFLLVVLSGCTPSYDYTIHKPRAYFKKPSIENLRKILKRKVGNDYVWAEEGPHKFDCSGLVYYAYGTMNLPVPRVASEQAKVGIRISRSKLKYGDLIFFDTTSSHSGKITHVGIYVGNGKFQHASNERLGVIITPLKHKYYSKRIVTCRRILSQNVEIADKPFKPKIDTVHADNKPKEVCTKCYEIKDKVTDASGGYYIQVGIFSHSPDESFLEHLRVSGYKYKIKKVSRYSTEMTQVLVGPFSSREKAQTILPDTHALFNPEAFIVKK